MTSTADLVTDSQVDLPKKTKIELTFKEMNISEKFSYIKEIITVEPIIGSYILGAMIILPAVQSLEFEKTCRSNLKLNETVCNAIRDSEHGNYSDVNAEITEIISNMHSWQAPLQTFMPLVLILFLGSFSDRHQLRKPFMMAPLIGELFAIVGSILSVIFMEEWSVEVMGILQTVVPTVLGSFTMLVMAIFSFIADVSSVEMRTLRVGIVQIILYIVFPLGSALSGIIFTETGYIGSLLITGALFAFGIVYCLFWIKEPKKPKVETKKNILLDMCDPTNVKDTFSLLFKKNNKNDRVALTTVMLIFFLFIGLSNGELSIMFLYTQNVFKWTSAEFAYYTTCTGLVSLVGSLVGVPLFTKVFSLTDTTILLVTFVNKILSDIVTALATTTSLVYVGAVVYIIGGVTRVALRSMATKLVSEDDLGKALSLFGVGESLGIMALTPFFNSVVFVNTAKTFPSAFLYCGCIVTVICCLLTIFMHYRKSTPILQDNGDLTNGKSIPMEDLQTHM